MQGQGRCQSGSHCWRGRGQGILDAQWGTRQWTAAQCQTQQSTSSSCGTAGLCPPLCFPVHREREVQVGMVDSKADSASQSACTSMTQTGIDTVSKAKQKPRKPPLLLPLFFFFSLRTERQLVGRHPSQQRICGAVQQPWFKRQARGVLHLHAHARMQKNKNKNKKKNHVHMIGVEGLLLFCVFAWLCEKGICSLTHQHPLQCAEETVASPGVT